MEAPRSQGEYCRRVAELCVRSRGSVTSWFRSAARNAAVGGSPDSKHLVGWAHDVVLDHMGDRERSDFVEVAKSYGLWAKDEKDHIHLQGLPPGPIPKWAFWIEEMY